MQVFLERDEPGVLPIPYWTPGDRKRRFWNLKRVPALAARIPELADCPELRGFVARMNGPKSRFATLGCDHWTKPVLDDDGVTHEAGIYVDLVLDRFEAAAKRRNAIDFFEKLRRHCSRKSEKASDRDLTIIRVQPQRVRFDELDRSPAWMMSTWVFGAGSTKQAAIAGRRRALDAVEAVCDLVSRDVQARAGGRGTPIPP
jgi:hypothetical protein